MKKEKAMKYSSSSSASSSYYFYFFKERCLNKGRLPPFFMSFLLLTVIFILFILYSTTPLTPISNQALTRNLRLPVIKPPPNLPRKGKPRIFHPPLQGYDDGISKCDLSKGHWIPDLRGSLYTNSSCTTIPDSKNCFHHGRSDRDFLNWRWKPDQCNLPRFDPKAFLDFVKGKTLGFVGDSVARNHMESLLCLLSKVETPKDEYKDSEDRKRIWYFPKHDFTLMILWSRYLVSAEERMVNGSLSGNFNLHLHKIDEEWSKDLPLLDYVIISAAHWFFRPIFVHNSTGIVGCVYCNTPNVKDYGVGFTLKLAFRSALNHINNCKTCKVRVTLVRTFSPAHFEDGAWNTGGRCNRTSPLGESEINLGTTEWELRSMQMEEIEKANIKGAKVGRRFGALDISRAMLMRPDGHPNEFWGNKWMKGYNDCVHWCLPGPVDVWNDFMMAVLRREASFIS
ncbi:hypothetical protein E1A91_D04G060000v1 [Gossypium mustelinum]|uniref:Uncharacterized protein n=1 Tax=Gossypium mustelinum TaxID=34275 RepID=A0A5D2VAJ7_GOSMU|nr:hypothetical protein E1A91_D04G060000v1 [Gossypium mustelinum]